MSTMVFVDTHTCVYIREKEERWRVKIGEGSRKDLGSPQSTIHARERERDTEAFGNRFGRLFVL